MSRKHPNSKVLRELLSVGQSIGPPSNHMRFCTVGSFVFPGSQKGINLDNSNLKRYIHVIGFPPRFYKEQMLVQAVDHSRSTLTKAASLPRPSADPGALTMWVCRVLSEKQVMTCSPFRRNLRGFCFCFMGFRRVAMVSSRNSTT